VRFGIAREIVTPSFKTYLGGYSSRYGLPFDHIHDDLYAKALLLDDGMNRLIMISLDLLFHEYSLTEEIKQYIATKYQIPEQYVLVTCTHTHTGPAVAGYDHGQHLEEYEAFLKARIVTCIERTFANTFEGEMKRGSLTGDWNVNRRNTKDGRMQMLPNPEGVKDDTADLLCLYDQTGRLRVLLVNYACHPVVITDSLFISGDYPGRLCQLLDASFYGCTSVFFQGAGGNLRPLITVQENRFAKRTVDEVNEMATAMAVRIEEEIRSNRLQKVDLKLQAVQFNLKLDMIPFGKQLLMDKVDDPGIAQSLRNAATKLLDHYEEVKEHVNLPAGIIRLNPNLYIGYMGGEPCIEIKKLLEGLFLPRSLIFIGYADSTAYIPDDKILEEGGYEAGSNLEYGLMGLFKPGIDKLVYDGFSEHLTQLLSAVR
jgi:neutral ceramidase